MTTITGWSSLLQINPDPETAAEAIRCIARSAAIQAKLVNDLLDMARINSRRFPISKSELDLAKVARDAVGASRLAATAKRVAMTLNAPEPILVQGDDIRMRQVMDNLLSNAVKFTPEGGSIEVEVMLEEGTAIIRVSDNGEGIPAAILPHVFDRHAQATAYRFGGLGLGLAIVHQIVELHGGSVTAESPGPGLGSTFTVRLPAAGPGPN
jgi:signal transduction histidine kinase